MALPTEIHTLGSRRLQQAKRGQTADRGNDGLPNRAQRVGRISVPLPPSVSAMNVARPGSFAVDKPALAAYFGFGR